MADITSSVTVTITEVSVTTSNSDSVTVKKDSAITDNVNDYTTKAVAQAGARMVIAGSITKNDGGTFADGDEIAVPVRAYAATGSRINMAMSTTDWTDLNNASGVIGQWKVTGSASNIAVRTINIKLNSRAAGQAVLTNLSMDLGSKGITSYGIGVECIAKFKIGTNDFAYGILARPRTVFRDSVFQAMSSNNNAMCGIRTGAQLYNDLIDSRGTSGTPEDVLVEAFYESSTSINLSNTRFANACPYSLTEQNGCFVTDYLVTNFKDVWTEITPTSGETYDAFKARVRAGKLRYGFYPTPDGVRVVYYAGVLGVDTPEWSTYLTTDLPATIADSMVEQGWYTESDKATLTSVYRSAIETNNIVGKHITANHFATEVYYDTVLEDTTYPSSYTITYSPGKSSEHSKDYTYQVKLTGMFGTIEVAKFAATVMKYDDDTKSPLGGAVVKLQIQSGSSWIDYTAGDGGTLSRETGDDGLVTFSNLGIGTYRVLETKAPDGYGLKKSPRYDATLNAVVSDTFKISASDTEGAKVQIGNVMDTQKATVTYKDITEGKTLITVSFEGESGTPMTYDADAQIAVYVAQGYEVLSNDYVKGTLFDDDTSVTQKFTIILKKVDDMDNVDCSACDDLRSISSDFVTKGVTKTICTSLKNDTGFNPMLKVLHDDCEDLDLANDCLIGMMDNELEKNEACDWQTFMHKFIPNVYQMFKAFGCAVCGLWTNVHNILDEVKKIYKLIDALQDQSERIDCLINYMYNGATFNIGENISGDAYAVAGKGVTYLQSSSSDEHASDIRLNYIAGGLMRFIGSFRFYNSDFTDVTACGNYDNGSTMTTSSNRKGNSFWGTTSINESFPSGGELICEIRIKRSSYPQISSIINGFGQESGGGSYSAAALVFNAGSYAYGQHGWCDSDGTPSASSFDAGHLVPEGWTYIQIRMTSALRFNMHEGIQYSPRIFMGVKMNQDEIKC